jgi:hypothetical protein
MHLLAVIDDESEALGTMLLSKGTGCAENVTLVRHKQPTRRRGPVTMRWPRTGASADVESDTCTTRAAILFEMPSTRRVTTHGNGA